MGKKWNGTDFTLETFADIWDPPLTGCGISQQEIDDGMFREVAARKGLKPQTAEETLPDTAILVGVELYLDQLTALDFFVEHPSVPLGCVRLVNLGGHSREEWDRLAPGIGAIPASPLVATWRNSKWESIVVGNKARDLLTVGLRDALMRPA